MMFCHSAIGPLSRAKCGQELEIIDPDISQTFINISEINTKIWILIKFWESVYLGRIFDDDVILCFLIPDGRNFIPDE